MTKLESLVPPRDLCQQIPPGSFDDSALVFLKQNAGNKYHPELWLVVERESTVDGETYFPAPTLAEIMADVGRSNCITCMHTTKYWVVNFDIGLKSWVCPSSARPSEAALKLWLEFFVMGK